MTFINNVTLQTQQFLCPSNSYLKGQVTKKTINKETDTTAIMLYSLKKEAGHERRKDKYPNKKNYEILPTPCPPHPHPDKLSKKSAFFKYSTDLSKKFKKVY